MAEDTGSTIGQEINGYTPEQIESIRKDPVGTYARATKILVTADKLDEATFKEAQTGLEIAKQFLPADFGEQMTNQIYTPEQRDMIAKDSIGAGKRSYDALASAGDTQSMIEAISGLYASKAAAARQGIDFNKVLKPKSAPEEVLDTIFNVLNLPQNALAGLATSAVRGNLSGDNWKLWGGSGFADTAHAAFENDPVFQSAVTKRAYGEELTPEEEQKLKDYQGAQLGGTLANISTLAIGAPAGIAAKVLGKVPVAAKFFKGIKAASEITDPLNAIAPAIKAYKAAKAFAGADEVADVVHGIAQFAKDESAASLAKLPTELLPEAQKAVDFADAILASKTVTTKDLETLKGIGRTIEGFAPEQGKKVTDALNQFGRQYNKELEAAANLGGIFKEVPEKILKLNRDPNLLQRFGQGFRKVFVTEAPGYAHKGIELAPEIERSIAVERGKTAKYLLDSAVAKAARKYKTTPEDVWYYINNATEAPEKLKAAADAARKAPKPKPGEVARVGERMVNPDLADDAIEMAAFANKASEDIIMAEAKRGIPVQALEFGNKKTNIPAFLYKYGDKDELNALRERSGLPPLPVGNGAKTAVTTAMKNEEVPVFEVWKALQREYVKRMAANHFDPALKDIEETMRGLIKATKVHAGALEHINMLNSLDNSEEMTREAMQYLPHYFTKEGWKWLTTHDPSILKGNARGVLAQMHGSALQRGALGDKTINELNQMVKNGEIFKGFASDPAWKGKIPKLFEDNAGKLVELRAKKGANAIRNAALTDNLRKLSEQYPNMIKLYDKEGLKALKETGNYPRGLVEVAAEVIDPATGAVMTAYAEPDVAKVVERLGKMTPPGMLAAAFDKIMSYWKKFNLQYVPAYHVRNGIGNIFNNYMAGLNPIGDVDRYIEAANLQNGRLDKVNFVKGARIWTGKKIMKAAQEQGLFRGTYGMAEGDANTMKVVDTLAMQLAQGGEKAKEALKLFPQTMENAGQAIEVNARLALFIHELRQGKSPAAAAETVKKFLYDYNDLTPIEKQVWRRVIPFYSFIKKNAVLQVQEMFNPGNQALRTVERIRDAANKQDQDTIIDERYQNDAMADTPKMLLHKDKASKREILLRLEGILPQYDVARVSRWISALKDNDATTALGWLSNLLKGIGKIGEQEVVANLTPLPKNVMELKANKNFFTGQPIRRTETDVNLVTPLGIPVPPEVAHVLKNIRLLGMLDQTTQSEEKMKPSGFVNNSPALSPATKALMWTVGKPTEYDQGMQKAVSHTAAKKEVESELAGLEYRIKKIALPSIYSGGAFPQQDYNLIREGVDKLIRKFGEFREKNMLSSADSLLINRIARLNQNLEQWRQSRGH